MNDYAERLAKQAVIVSQLHARLQHEMEVMAGIVKGTPPTLWPGHGGKGVVNRLDGGELGRGFAPKTEDIK